METPPDAELNERRASINFALGSLRLEGLTPSPIARGIYEDFAAGRLDDDGFSRALDQLADMYKRAAAAAA